MDEPLLKQYIKLILEKKFDFAPVVAKHQPSEDELKVAPYQVTVDSPEFLNSSFGRKFTILKNKLRLVNVGSSRAVFIQDSHKVIKLALNAAGVEQNENEAKAFKDHSIRKWVPKIYKIASDYSWIISELVRPLNSVKEFDEIFPVSYGIMSKIFNGTYSNFLEFIQDAYDRPINMWKKHLVEFETNPQKPLYGLLKGMSVEQAKNKVKEIIEEFETAKKDKKAIKMVSQLFDLVATGKISGEEFLPSDMGELPNLGKTADGRIVLLDTGANSETLKKWY